MTSTRTPQSGTPQSADSLDSEPELLYEGPMNPLISALKTFSLSSAVLSAVGLPGIMIFKGLDVYSGVHIAMVGTTVAGSIASTLGLQWIFSPYVYTLESIPVPSSTPEEGNHDNKTTTTTETRRSDKSLLKATTRSIFLMPVVHVFDPETDIQGVPSGNIRPFCSFLAKSKPLYVHEQMIEDRTIRRHLFINNATPIQQIKNPDPDDEFL